MDFKWVSNGNQDMIASTSYRISKQGQANILEIKHKMHANKLKSNKNMQKFQMLIFKHQNRILVCTENIIELCENERTCRLQKSYMCYSLPTTLSLSLIPRAPFQTPLLFPDFFFVHPSQNMNPRKKTTPPPFGSPFSRFFFSCKLLPVPLLIIQQKGSPSSTTTIARWSCLCHTSRACSSYGNRPLLPSIEMPNSPRVVRQIPWSTRGVYKYAHLQQSS